MLNGQLSQAAAAGLWLNVHIPAVPGVYAICTDTGIPYYVGASLNIRKRLKEHARKAAKSGYGPGYWILRKPTAVHILMTTNDPADLSWAEIRWKHRLGVMDQTFPHHSWSGSK